MFSYLLSEIIDYKLLICRDAGPGFAEDMGWSGLPLSDARRVNDEVFIIDPRIVEDETLIVEQLVKDYPNKSFILRVADPFAEIYENHFYYRFLRQNAGNGNVFLLSTYQPAELVLTLKTLFNQRFLHLPYPYLKARETAVKLSRKNKILISGSLDKAVYPYRYSIWAHVTRSWLRFLFQILPHPGYADVNASGKRSHTIVGQRYIDYIAGFKYMLLCPSRCYLEFLKFYECAYAGCIPVGVPPQSYPEEIRFFFRRLEVKTFIKDVLSIFFEKDEGASVSKIRHYLQSTRSPDMLNDCLKSFLRENSVYSS